MTILITGILCCILTGGIGYFLLPILRTLKAGQSIREVGPTWHNNKAGTPMMGGLMFILGTHPHLSRNVGGNHVAVVQFDAKHCVREGLHDGSVLFDSSLLCHKSSTCFCFVTKFLFCLARKDKKNSLFLQIFNYLTLFNASSMIPKSVSTSASPLRIATANSK